MRYLSVAEIAKKWDVSERSVRNYCAQGRVNGAFLTGKTWNIPENAEKPERINKRKEGPITLVDILKEPKLAILKQYQKLLALDEVDLQFEEGALTAIAEKAMEKDTGARALRAIIEKFMLDIMYEIPKDDTIGSVTITRDYIENHGNPEIHLRDQ